MVAARAMTLTAFCALIGLIALRRRGSLYVRLAAALAAASVAQGFALDRPYHFTYLLLAMTMAILEFRRGLWLLPPLFAVWANCHSGYFLGWVVLGAWCAESLVQRRRDVELWMVSGLSVLASGLNPNGFAIFRTLLNYQGSYLTSRLIEWARPSLWPPSAFSVLLVAAAAAMIWARRRVRIADWLIFAAFAAAALAAQRNTILVGLVAPIMLAAYLPWPWDKRWRLRRLFTRSLVALLLRLESRRAWRAAVSSNAHRRLESSQGRGRFSGGCTTSRSRCSTPTNTAAT